MGPAKAKTKTAPARKKTAPARKSPARKSNGVGVSIKIPRSAYRAAQRIAKREQRTITTVVERAIVQYEGSSK